MDVSGLSTARSTLTAGVVALFVESLLFGAFTILYGFSVWFLVFRERPQGYSPRDIMLFAASTFMFVLSMIHIALDFHIAVECLVIRSGVSRAMAEAYDLFNDLSSPLGAAKFAIYVTQTLIGDGFMIYRTYVVWDRIWRVVVLPLILLFAEVVLGYFVSFYGRFGEGVTQSASCVNAFFVLSVVTNLLSTGLIMKRILWSHSRVHDYRFGDTQIRNVKWRVIESILQSAAIYSIASISLAITSFTSPTVAFPACHSVFPSVIGIVFLLIVVRISMNGACSAEISRHSLVQPNGGSSASVSTAAVHLEEDLERQSRRSCPIAIHVSVSTMSDQESVSFGRGSPLSEKGVVPLNSPDVEETPISLSPKVRSATSSDIPVSCADDDESSEMQVPLMIEER